MTTVVKAIQLQYTSDIPLPSCPFLFLHFILHNSSFILHSNIRTAISFGPFAK